MAGMLPGMVIVGAGEFGTRAALALREAGFDGPVTLFGTEPHSPAPTMTIPGSMPATGVRRARSARRRLRP